MKALGKTAQSVQDLLDSIRNEETDGLVWSAMCLENLLVQQLGGGNAARDAAKDFCRLLMED